MIETTWKYMKYIVVIRNKGIQVSRLDKFIGYQEYIIKGYAEINISSEKIKVFIVKDFCFDFNKFIKSEENDIMFFEEHPEQTFFDKTGLGETVNVKEDF